LTWLLCIEIIVFAKTMLPCDMPPTRFMTTNRQQTYMSSTTLEYSVWCPTYLWLSLKYWFSFYIYLFIF
jgi:hypothetical protein